MVMGRYNRTDVPQAALIDLYCMIKLFLSVGNVIHANEHAKQANCGLYVNF